MKKGIILAISAYLFWGLHPIYWKLLKELPSTEILAHRILWSLIFFIIVLSFRKQWKELFIKIKQNNKKRFIILPSILIGTNWGLYIWAVNQGFIIETSLGYFISPLLNVFLGVIFLQEKLRKLQWLAVSIAGVSVFLMGVLYGQFPWIAIVLASSWALYGLLRKKSPLTAIEGLAIETAILSTLAFIFFLFSYSTNSITFNYNLTTWILLIGTGVVSGLPLIVFIVGIRLVNLSLIGFLQYIYPMLLFIIATLVYNEPLTDVKIYGFVLIWIALLVFSLDGVFIIKAKK